jgi:Flp pilus assembly protein TadG
LSHSELDHGSRHSIWRSPQAAPPDIAASLRRAAALEGKTLRRRCLRAFDWLWSIRPVAMRTRSGQSMVEFAIMTPIVVIILILAVQGAIIGDTFLALSQVVYQAARYAAVNPSYDQSTISNYAISVASPAISENNGADLTVSVNPAAAPRSFGTSVTVTITYNAHSKVLIPNPFLGVKIPTTLTATRTAMSE